MRPVIHNRRLPEWAHRLASGALVCAVTAGVGASGLTGGPLVARLSRWLVYGSPILGVLAGALAHRFSFVRGLAGEVGYDDLE